MGLPRPVRILVTTHPALLVTWGTIAPVILLPADARACDDVREIIEAVRYAAVSARYKIYIIDEVHMLSRNAFNALLKTLEEPPAHVKFLFATTEVDKLPVTVLSRCQRFDLRRIPKDLLEKQFGESRRPRASRPSPRRWRSSLGRRRIEPRRAVDPRPGDRPRRRRGHRGARARHARPRRQGRAAPPVRRAARRRSAGVLAEVERQYALGVEPLALVRSLMELIHRIAGAQIGGAGPMRRRRRSARR